MKKTLLAQAILFSTLIMLTACGGGGSSSGDSANNGGDSANNGGENPNNGGGLSCEIYSDIECTTDDPIIIPSQSVAGNTLKIIRETDTNNITTETYNSNGVITHKIEDAVNPPLTFIPKEYYYRPDGQIEKKVYGINTDYYEYNSNNQLIKIKVDGGTNGSFDKFEIYTYDNGLLKTKTIDQNADNDATDPTDVIFEYSYDGEKLIKVVNNNENSTSQEKFYEYDCNGNLSKITYRENSTNEDGAIVKVESFFYNNKNQLVRSETNNIGENGTINKSVTKNYFCDLEKISEITTDAYGSGANISKVTYFYDASGNVAKIAKDSNGDGANDSVTTIKVEGDLSILPNIIIEH